MTPDDIATRLLHEGAPAWRPEPGTTITGAIVRLSKRHTDYGDHLVLTLKDDDDTYHAVHAMHSVLKDRLFDLKPKVGETITVAYHGKVGSKDKDREYHAYTVINHSHLEEAGAEFTWDDEEPAF